MFFFTFRYLFPSMRTMRRTQLFHSFNLLQVGINANMGEGHCMVVNREIRQVIGKSAGDRERQSRESRNGFTWSINNGMVEGHVKKLNSIKRQMHGKVAFALLRQRVLHALWNVRQLFFGYPLSTSIPARYRARGGTSIARPKEIDSFCLMVYFIPIRIAGERLICPMRTLDYRLISPRWPV